MSITPRAGLGVFEGYHSAQVQAKVRLNTNESPFPPPPELLSRWQEKVVELSLNRYPDRSADALRSAIAKFHKVSQDMVFVANGSNEVIQTILLSFGTSGARAVSFEPTYAMYETIARVTNTSYSALERLEDFSISTQTLASDLKDLNPSVTFVCAPNNPTGIAEDSTTIDLLGSEAPGLVVIDEAYGQFSPISQVGRTLKFDNIAVVRTFSKIWSLAGMRIGYCIAPPPIVDILWKVALPYHLDSSKQLLATLCFDYVAEMEERVAFLVSQRIQLELALGELGIQYWPSSANFILFRPKGVDAADLWRRLLDKGVLIRDWSKWPRLANCLRVTVGTQSENDYFLEALTHSLNEMSASW